MIRFCSIILVTILLFVKCQHPSSDQSNDMLQDPADFVNPMIGTDAHGHTYPGATLPFGMVQLSPDTRLEGWDGCSGYHYSDDVVFGFSHTHLSGTGVPDYCDILFMPATGDILLDNGAVDASQGYASHFRHENEIATPGYYKSLLDDYNITVELTASKRVGFHKYTFPEAEGNHVIIDLLHRDKVLDSWLEVVNDTLVQGYRRSTGWARDQRIYFSAVFSAPLNDFGLALDDLVGEDSLIEGKNVKGYFEFNLPESKQLLVKVGISAVSAQGALNNLLAEIPGWDFEHTREQARSAWNDELKKIEVSGGSDAQKTTFYSALYHAYLVPNLFMDVDGKYLGRDFKVHQTNDFDYYTVFSLWDTFRGEHPLFTITQQQRTVDLIKTMITEYEQGGRLPVWEFASNETECMIGYHSIPVIADAYMKGITGFDEDNALEAMIHSAEMDHFGLKYYKEKGYIPAQDESESVSKTLEYAYDDWCIAMMAKKMGRKDVYEKFIKRAQSWKNVFDPSTGFMRARMKGGWFSPFDPKEVNFNYTEANAWQYSFFVPQDVSGLMDYLGGREELADRLDRLFTESPETTGREQSDITGLIGQYAQGNEPSHHMAYLYNYVGEPWKAQQRSRQIMDEMYNEKPDGLCGNEDCGQMSAWYVLSAMGFYPVTPADPVYTFGSPLFDQVTLHLENGKTFVIRAEDHTPGNIYIQSAKLNGKPYSRSFLNHEDIINGGDLVFKMGPEPSKTFGTAEGDIPVSAITDHLIMPVPFVMKGSRIFTDTTLVALGSVMLDAIIYYTLDGSQPDENAQIYEKPFLLSETTYLKAIAVKEGLPESNLLEAEFHKVPKGRTITLNTRYANQYAAGGDLALIDHVRGPENFRTGAWQGYHGNDLDAVIDLGSIQLISSVETGFIQDAGAWIFMPQEVQYFVSKNGKDFQRIGTVKNKVPEKEFNVTTENFTLPFSTKARYIKVVAKNRGTCPEWHVGAGEPAWIFADEIVIK